MVRHIRTSAVIVACTFALSLSGCGSSDDDSSTTSSSTSTSATTATTAATSSTSGAPITVATAPSASKTKVTIVGEKDCGNKQTEADMRDCYNANLKAADDQLNTVYQALLPKLSEADRQKLVQEEKDWIAQRNSSCDKAATGLAGSGASREYLACQASETRKRLVTLIDRVNR